jgi:putative flippase GtrA
MKAPTYTRHVGDLGTPQPQPSRVHRVLGEVVRFLTVGGVATAVSFVGFNALVHGMLLGRAPLESHPIPAYVLVNLLAGVLAYLGMRLWAFRDRTAGDPAAGVVRFFTLGALTMAIPVVCLWVSRDVLGLSSPLSDNVSANVVGLSLGAGARFWVFRRYVFNDVATPEPYSGIA